MKTYVPIKMKTKPYSKMSKGELFAYRMRMDNYLSALCRSSAPNKFIYRKMDSIGRIIKRTMAEYDKRK